MIYPMHIRRFVCKVLLDGLPCPASYHPKGCIHGLNRGKEFTMAEDGSLTSKEAE